MTKPKNDIPLDYLRECFDLDPTTPSGLRWRYRADRPPQWNEKWAGKQAGFRDGLYWRVDIVFGGRTRHVRTHRIILALTNGHWPPEQVDHVRGAEAGNHPDNLRPATPGQNAQNHKKHRDNTSGFPGVFWSDLYRKWFSQIGADGRYISLGYFGAPEEAFAAYLVAKAILHPFAPTLRGVPAPELHSFDRLRTAHRIVRAARSRGDATMELAAWEHFCVAL